MLLTATFLSWKGISQAHSFSVEPASFTSNSNNEFGPVFYHGGVVYCSNSTGSSAISIKSGEQKLYNLMYAALKDSASWKSPVFFARELTTMFNDGPATFNTEGTKVFYARNTFIEGKLKNINDPSNKLGIFSAELIEGKWQNITPFPHNNIEYSMGTPSLEKEGTRLFFASDKPGGFGGTDIYYSELKSGNWQEPVNLGKEINTSYNESYPYASESGMLFFASDRPGGIGGKDVYYTFEEDKNWVKPVLLDQEINSEYDDYGIVTDKNFQYGFISSNRKGSEDIFYFNAELPQFTFCKPQQENKRCFEFYDERYVDTLYLEYEWDFGNGIKKSGFKVKHCFSRGGHHDVQLTVLHNIADTVIRIPTSYSFDLEDIEQAYIMAPDVWAVNVPFQYNGKQTNLPNLEISDYRWNFNDGFRDKQIEGSSVYTETGEKQIQLGVIGVSKTTNELQKQCVTKDIRILEDMQAVASQSKPYSESNRNSLIEPNGADTKLNLKTYYLGAFSEVEKYALDKMIASESVLSLSVTNQQLEHSSEILLNKYLKYLESNEDSRMLIAIHTNENRSARKNQEVTEQWGNIITKHLQNKSLAPGRVDVISYGDSRIQSDKKERNQKELIRWIDIIVYK